MRLSLVRKDYTRTSILSKKISARFFADPKQNDLKLLYYGYLVELARHHNEYLELCKHLRAIYDTPQIQADSAQALAHLRDAVIYVILAPYDNEQSDLVARVAQEPRLKELPELSELLQSFVTDEVGFGVTAVQLQPCSPSCAFSPISFLFLFLLSHDLRIFFVVVFFPSFVSWSSHIVSPFLFFCHPSLPLLPIPLIRFLSILLPVTDVGLRLFVLCI